jgi:hypothetical protein
MAPGRGALVIQIDTIGTISVNCHAAFPRWILLIAVFFETLGVRVTNVIETATTKVAATFAATVIACAASFSRVAAAAPDAQSSPHQEQQHETRSLEEVPMLDDNVISVGHCSFKTAPPTIFFAVARGRLRVCWAGAGVIGIVRVGADTSISLAGWRSLGATKEVPNNVKDSSKALCLFVRCAIVGRGTHAPRKVSTAVVTQIRVGHCTRLLRATAAQSRAKVADEKRAMMGD